MAVLVRGNHLWLANAGDSRAVLVRRKQQGGRTADYTAADLTVDQKPDSPLEQAPHPVECTVQCAVECTVQCAVQCAVECAMECIMPCTVQCTVQCAVECTMECAMECAMQCTMPCTAFLGAGAHPAHGRSRHAGGRQRLAIARVA